MSNGTATKHSDLVASLNPIGGGASVLDSCWTHLADNNQKSTNTILEWKPETQLHLNSFDAYEIMSCASNDSGRSYVRNYILKLH